MASQEFEKAAEMRDREQTIRKQLEAKRQDWQTKDVPEKLL